MHLEFEVENHDSGSYSTLFGYDSSELDNTKDNLVQLKSIRWDRDIAPSTTLTVGDGYKFNFNNGLFHYSTDVLDRAETDGVYLGFSNKFMGGNKNASEDTTGPTIGVRYHLETGTADSSNDFDLGIAGNNSNIYGHVYYNMTDYGVNVNLKKAGVDFENKANVGLNAYYKLGDLIGTKALAIAGGIELDTEAGSVSDYQISVDSGEITTFKDFAALRVGGAWGGKLDHFEAWVEVDAKIPYVKFQAGIVNDEKLVTALKANFNF